MTLGEKYTQRLIAGVDTEVIQVADEAYQKAVCNLGRLVDTGVRYCDIDVNTRYFYNSISDPIIMGYVRKLLQQRLQEHADHDGLDLVVEETPMRTLYKLAVRIPAEGEVYGIENAS